MNKTITSLYILGAMLSPFAMAYDYDEQECLPAPDYVEGYFWGVTEAFDLEKRDMIDYSEVDSEILRDYQADALDQLIDQQDEMLFSNPDELNRYVFKISGERLIDEHGASESWLEYELSIFENQKAHYDEFAENLTEAQTKEIKDMVNDPDWMENYCVDGEEYLDSYYFKKYSEHYTEFESLKEYQEALKEKRETVYSQVCA